MEAVVNGGGNNEEDPPAPRRFAPPSPRERVKKLFLIACHRHPRWHELSEETAASIVRKLERSCLRQAIADTLSAHHPPHWGSPPFTSRYSAITYRVLYSLDTDLIGSPYLISEIIDGRINPSEVGTMTSHELCPEATARARDEVTARMNIKAEKKVSRRYYCKKCGFNETVFLECQTRAADEVSTNSIKCCRCGNVWRT